MTTRGVSISKPHIPHEVHCKHGKPQICRDVWLQGISTDTSPVPYTPAHQLRSTTGKHTSPTCCCCCNPTPPASAHINTHQHRTVSLQTHICMHKTATLTQGLCVPCMQAATRGGLQTMILHIPRHILCSHTKTRFPSALDCPHRAIRQPTQLNVACVQRQPCA